MNCLFFIQIVKTKNQIDANDGTAHKDAAKIILNSEMLFSTKKPDKTT